jgi:hypothetical protein
MLTLSPVSNTNESGRESLILTLTTIWRVTNSNGIVTGAALAAGFELGCATHKGAAASVKTRMKRLSRILRLIQF